MSLRCPLKWEGLDLGIISNGIEYFAMFIEGDVLGVPGGREREEFLSKA